MENELKEARVTLQINDKIARESRRQKEGVFSLFRQQLASCKVRYQPRNLRYIADPSQISQLEQEITKKRAHAFNPSLSDREQLYLQKILNLQDIASKVLTQRQKRENRAEALVASWAKQWKLLQFVNKALGGSVRERNETQRRIVDVTQKNADETAVTNLDGQKDGNSF